MSRAGVEGYRIHYAAKPEFCIGLAQDASPGNGKPIVLQTIGAAELVANKQVWTIRAGIIRLEAHISQIDSFHACLVAVWRRALASVSISIVQKRRMVL